MEPEIIYEDRDVAVINKPPGLLVHKTKVSEEPTLADWLLEKYPEIKDVGDLPAGRQVTENIRPGIVHRLDKETSGVMIVARNQAAFDHLKKLFQSRDIKKTYLALVWGKVAQKSGVIEKPLGIKTGTLKRTTRVEGAGVKMIKEAKTAYRVKKYIGEYTLLEVEPLTGRTHQIRAHLASIGHPVVGDRLYGRKAAPAGLTRMFLHAESLELTLPNGSRTKFTADLPPDLNPELFAPENPESRS